MRILFKYVSKLFFGPFLMGLGGFIVFVSVELLYQLSNIIVRNRVGIEKLFVLIYYNLPSFTADGIPVGVLLAIFWIISTLSQRRELMAMQVHGISLKNLFFPFLVLSLSLSFVVYLLNDFVVPDYYVKSEHYMSEEIFKKPKVEDYVVSESVIRYKDKFIYVGEYDKKHEVMTDVMIIDYSGRNERVMTAEKVYRKGNSWYLMNGRLYIVDDNGIMKLDSTYKKLKLNFKEDLGFLLAYPSEKKMSHSELVNAIRETKDRKMAAKWIVEIQRRYATALAPLIIVLAGLSFSLLFNLTSKSWGVILTFVIVVLYQGSGAWLSAMGREMIIDPVLAVWLPNIFFGGIGLILLAFVDTVAVQRIREILVRMGFGVILILSTLGFGYTVKSDELVLNGNVMTMVGNVRIYEKGELKATAERAVYYMDEDQMILYNATSVGKDHSLRAATHLSIERISYDEEVSGIVNTKDSSITIESASVVVSFKDVRLVKEADLEVLNKRENFVSKVRAIFLITDENEVKDGMGVATGKKEKRNFVVKVARMKSSKDMQGVIGTMDVKLGKKMKKMYFAGNYLLVLKNDLELVGAYITTCSANPPHYYIAFEKAFVTKDYVAARNSIVFINDFPVIYFPYFFQFFKDPKPVSMSFGIGSKKKGVSFAFSASTDGWKASYSKSDRSSAFSMSGKLLSHPVSLSWKGGKTGITVKNFFWGTLGISSSRSVTYTYSFSKKIGKSVLKLFLKRYYSGGRVSWIIPNVSISKIAFTVPFVGGKFSIGSWRHSGALSYDEGSIFDHLSDISGRGKITMGYSRSLIKFSGTGLKGSLTTTYDATPSGFKDYSVSGKTSVSLYSKKIDLKWIALSASRYFSFSANLKKGEDGIPKSLSDSEKYSLSVKIPFISSGLTYERSAAYSGKEDLSRTSATNRISLSGSLSFPFIPLVISAGSAYDFLAKDPKFSYPSLKAVSSIKFGDFSANFSASTRYLYDKDQKFDKISFSTVQSYKKNKFRNSMGFTYVFGEDVPVSKIVDKFSAKSLNLFGYPISGLSGILTYSFGKDKSKVTYFSAKLLNNFEHFKNSFFFKYRTGLDSDDTYLNFSYSLGTVKIDPSVKLSLGTSFENEDLTSYNFSLSLKKSLHCWTMNFDIKGDMSGDGIRFTKIFLSFTVNDLSGKGFNYDMLSGEYNVGLM